MNCLKGILACFGAQQQSAGAVDAYEDESSTAPVLRPDDQRSTREEDPPPAVSVVAGGSQCCDRCDEKMDKLWSAVHTLRIRLDRNDAELDQVLDWKSKATFSPTYVTEEQETISGAIFENPSVLEDENQSIAVQRQMNVESSTFTDNSSHECYKMNHENRGKCIIFSHEMFKYNLDRRTCANDEAKLVERTFKKLGFQVTIHKDSTYSKIKKILAKLSNQDYTKDDCICIFIMSHGEDHGHVWALDTLYPIEIFEETLSNIHTLADKPKLMFIQTCRGERVDQGINPHKEDTESSDETDYTTISNKTPTKADFFIAHSTPPGFQSFRQWFIPTLCNMIDRFSEVDDIDSILIKTTNEVCKYESNHTEVKKNKAKQAPSVTKTLRKKLYLRRT